MESESNITFGSVADSSPPHPSSTVQVHWAEQLSAPGGGGGAAAAELDVGDDKSNGASSTKAISAISCLDAQKGVIMMCQ
eukprot:COSAG01_NODE_21354_length_905_cov_3.983871_1_plen_80_part_00